jgi:hypothetical protein
MVLRAERGKIDYGAVQPSPRSRRRSLAFERSAGERRRGEGWPIPLVGWSIENLLRNSNLACALCDRGATGLGLCSFPTSTRCHYRHAGVR